MKLNGCPSLAAHTRSSFEFDGLFVAGLNLVMMSRYMNAPSGGVDEKMMESFACEVS